MASISFCWQIVDSPELTSAQLGSLEISFRWQIVDSP